MLEVNANEVKKVGRLKEAAEVAEAVKIISTLPDAERAKVLYMLKGIALAAENPIPHPCRAV